jgi:ligand-binding SRPBCC domain-containing protein
MQLQVRTKIKQPYLQVKEGFNEQLFKKLNPPFPKVVLKRFDGCKKGDLVNMQLNFIAFKQTWESLITADDTTEGYFFFQDEGKQLPFFLKQWKHRHWVRKVDEFNSEIVDDIHFSTGNILTDVFMYPLMKAQFLYRKPIYRKFFN